MVGTVSNEQYLNKQLMSINSLIASHREVCDKDPNSFAYILSMQSLVKKRNSIEYEIKKENDKIKRKNSFL